MKAMNCLIVIGLMISANAFAARCASDNVKNEFLGYNPANPDPQYNSKLYARYASAVLPDFIRYNETAFSDPQSRVNAFRCLVSVEAAAQKWDGEGDGIALLAKNQKDPILKQALQNELRNFPDRCRAGLLEALVNTRACHDVHGDRETPDQSAYCDKKYDTGKYKQCQDLSKAEKKSPNKVATQPCSDSPYQPTGVNASFFTAFKRALSPQSQLDSTSDGSNGVAQTSRRAKAKVGAPLQLNPHVNSRRPASLEQPVYEVPDENSTAQ